MKQRTPPLTVVMPVLNAGDYLDGSIASLADQTFRDFEVVVWDDGSSDGSTAKCRAWAEADPRVRLVESDTTAGIAGSSNAVMSLARAPLVARMDADDLCHPRRLETQMALMTRHPDVVLVGTLFCGIDASGRTVRPRDRSPLLRTDVDPPFPHGSVMLRKASFEQVGGYEESYSGWCEDKDLIRRLAGIGRVLVLPEPLYLVRFHTRSSTVTVPETRALAVARNRAPLRGADADRSHQDLLVDVLFLKESIRLWAGERPALLRALVTHRLVGWQPRRLAVLIWAAWGWASPGSLRSTLRAWIRIRDLAASLRIRDGEPREWCSG